MRSILSARGEIPQMRKQGKDAVVNTASTSALHGDYSLCSYSAAKADIVNLTRVTALDHAKEGIRVKCVCPGYTITSIEDFCTHAEMNKELLESIPQGRGCESVELARTVLFLASDDASYTNGHGKDYVPKTLTTLAVALVIYGGWESHRGAPNFLKLRTPQVCAPLSKLPWTISD